MGKYQPGESGNPAGRPKGSVNKQLAYLRSACNKLLPAMFDRACAGDFEAQKFLLDRALPRLKAVSPAETFDLPDAPRLEQLLALLQQTADGEISPSVAVEVAGVIGLACKVEEIDSLRAEVNLLKETLERRVVRKK